MACRSSVSSCSRRFRQGGGLGPQRLADDGSDGALPRPDCAQAWRRARGRQGQALSGALARVLDRPCARRQFRCAGRDEETAAQPNKETGQPGLRGPDQGSWVDEGKAASQSGVPVPIPTRCREAGNGNGERTAADQGSARR